MNKLFAAVLAGAALALSAPVFAQTALPSFAPVIKRASPAVVNIAVRGTVAAPRNPFFDDPGFRRFFGLPPDAQQREREFRSAGSGVIVDAANGYIVTNAHVVQNASEITITLVDDVELKAEVVGVDDRSDVAVLKVKDAKLPAEIRLADSSKLQVGDFVIAIGNPFGLQHTVTSGIVSALGRSGISRDGLEDFIQTDAAINPGNSGGALVGLDGDLVGINSVILSQSGGNIGIGFAIPSNMVRSIMEQLIETGRVNRGQLGVNTLSLTPEFRKSLGLAENAQGALVSQVTEGSAAAKAGIEAGDVITSRARPADPQQHGASQYDRHAEGRRVRRNRPPARRQAEDRDGRAQGAGPGLGRRVDPPGARGRRARRGLGGLGRRHPHPRRSRRAARRRRPACLRTTASSR